MHLDLPATSPKMYHKLRTLDVGATENIKINAILGYIRLFHTEVGLSQSAKERGYINRFDLHRWRSYFQQLIMFIDGKDTETIYERVQRLELENKYLRKLVERKNKEIEKWKTQS